jgi:hypothetical protein
MSFGRLLPPWRLVCCAGSLVHHAPGRHRSELFPPQLHHRVRLAPESAGGDFLVEDAGGRWGDFGVVWVSVLMAFLHGLREELRL